MGMFAGMIAIVAGPILGLMLSGVLSSSYRNKQQRLSKPASLWVRFLITIGSIVLATVLSFIVITMWALENMN
jgi:hypothetical protein